MNEETSQLYDPAHQRDPSEIFRERAGRLEEITRAKAYDVVVTELFPFGRGKFRDEILRLLSLVRAANPRALRVCSARDILVGKDDAWERKVVGLVREHYDHVLVHADERVVRFEETFARAAEIPLFYTGFVTENGRRALPTARRPEILVSFGGGAVGEELARAVLAVAPRFSGHRFRFVVGPHATPAVCSMIEAARGPNVCLEAFFGDFESELAGVALSISLAGYNTLMNILATATPALVFPYDRNQEQGLRARRLEALGQVKVLERTDLEPGRMETNIRAQLNHRPPATAVNLEGGRESARQLRAWTEEWAQLAGIPHS